VYGSVERINPEAPVPVLRTARTETRVGGTGNVAVAALALGARVACVGAIGRDDAGEELGHLLMVAGAETPALLRLPGRSTPVKTRYVGLAQHRNAQQMLRVDTESVEPLDPQPQVTLRGGARAAFAEADIVVLEDYDKGLLTDALTPELIADARRAGRPVLVDPACIADYRRYRGATVLKPNRYEAALASGIAITDDASLAAAAQRLLELAEADAIIVTLDQEGMYVRQRDGTGGRVPHQRPRAVYEVSGAGDETLAVLAVALADGCDCATAAELANVAGGLEVERFGFVAIRREEGVDELRRMIGLRGGKRMAPKHLLAEIQRRRELGETIVFTNGCFDLLHMGHVRYLQGARELGSCLIVAINSDDSVRRLKGPGRPVIGQDERAEMLGALECVDHVTVFEEDTPEALLELLRPDLLVKGGTTEEVVGREIVEGYGGRVLTLKAVEGLSTTTIINRILAGNSSEADPAAQ